jgi:hypothetical protein
MEGCLLRSTCLLCDEREAVGMCGFFRFYKAFAAHVVVFPLHLNLAQGESRLQLQSNKT